MLLYDAFDTITRKRISIYPKLPTMSIRVERFLPIQPTVEVRAKVAFEARTKVAFEVRTKEAFDVKTKLAFEARTKMAFEDH